MVGSERSPRSQGFARTAWAVVHPENAPAIATRAENRSILAGFLMVSCPTAGPRSPSAAPAPSPLHGIPDAHTAPCLCPSLHRDLALHIELLIIQKRVPAHPAQPDRQRKLGVEVEDELIQQPRVPVLP